MDINIHIAAAIDGDLQSGIIPSGVMMRWAKAAQSSICRCSVSLTGRPLSRTMRMTPAMISSKA
jgi:hypothetical protein